TPGRRCSRARRDHFVELSFADDLRSALLGLIELAFARFVSGDEVRRVFLHAVVHLAAGRSNVGMHVLALPREDAGDAKAQTLQGSFGRQVPTRLRPTDAGARELAHEATLFGVVQEGDDAVDHFW